MQKLSLPRLKAILNQVITNNSPIWPTPIAKNLFSLLNNTNDAQEIIKLIDSLAAFLGSLLMSIYINNPQKNYLHNNFNRTIWGFLRPKTHTMLGHWVDILREGLGHFKSQSTFFMPELLLFADGISDPLKLVPEKVRIVTMDRHNNSLFDSLKDFRNRCLAHPENLPDYLKDHNIPLYHSQDDNVHAAFREGFPDLIRLLDGLQFLSEYWLFYINNLAQENGDRLVEILRYRSTKPHYYQLKIDDSVDFENLFEGGRFDEANFRCKLFMAKIKNASDCLHSLPIIERAIEVNPILISWVRGNERRPHRFLEWKDIKQKQIWMVDILVERGKVEVEDDDTQNRLWEAYATLIEKLDEYDEDVQTQQLLTRELSRKRFEKVREKKYAHRLEKFENAPNRIIAEEILPGIYMPQNKSESENLYHAVKHLWKTPRNWHGILVGEGGMGKTTSLLNVWQHALEDEKGPIPVFIRLEGYNKQKTHKKKFIWYTIAEEYLDTLDMPVEEKMRKIEIAFKQSTPRKNKTAPSFILLLDGFNEIRDVDDDLSDGLEKLRELENIQIIISSRYDLGKLYGWWGFNTLTLQDLREQQIKEFITCEVDEGEILWNNTSKEVRSLIRNPMMLALYCDVEEERQRRKESKYYDFVPSPCSRAEILHNFIVSTMSRQDRESLADKVVHRLSLRHLLPKIGYEMEKATQLKISHNQLRELIEEEWNSYLKTDFRRRYPKIDKQITSDDVIKRYNITQIIDDLARRSCLLVEDETSDDEYTFVHQYFRDYFAAAYITEQLDKFGINSVEDFSKDLFEPHLRQMLGELTSEPRRRPVLFGNYKSHKDKPTVFDNALTGLREEPGHGKLQENNYRLLNVLEILKDTRVDLSDTDLSRLDLRHIVLNNVRLGHGTVGGQQLSADLAGSTVQTCTFLPQWHWGEINVVRYSPDGQKILSAGKDNTIKEWDIHSGECLQTYKGHSKGITSVAYNSEGTRIVSGSLDETFREWDVKNGRCLRIYEGHYFDYISSVSYSPDGKRIIAGAGANDCTIKEWDVEDGEWLTVFQGHTEGITSVCYSPDGDKILSGSEDKTIKEWDLETGDCLFTYEGHFGVVTSVSYNSDGTKIVSGSEDETVGIWDVKTKELVPCTGHHDRVNFVTFNPDGTRIVSCSGTSDSGNLTIIEWNAQTGKHEKIYKDVHTDGINCVNYNHDGSRIVSGSNDGTIKEWNVMSNECIRTYRGYSGAINSVMYHPSDQKKVIAGTAHGTIKIWDIETGECFVTYKSKTDNNMVVKPGSHKKEFLSTSSEGILEKWNLETGICLAIYQKDKEKFISLRPDGKKVVSVGTDGKIKEWGLNGKSKKPRTYSPHSDEVKRVASISYSANDEKFLSACGNTIKEWDIRTRKCVNTLELVSYQVIKETITNLEERWGTEKVAPLKPFVNEKYWKKNFHRELTALGFDENDIGTIMEETVREADYAISFIQYRPDEKNILTVRSDNVLEEGDVSTGNIIEEWDLSTKECCGTYTCTYPEASSVTYSPDGSKIAAANGDIIEEWDRETGERRMYKGHFRNVTSISYSPNGKRMLSGSEDGTIREWDTATQERLHIIENRFGLLVQGVDMSNLHFDSEINNDEKEILKQYGAIFDSPISD